MLQTKSIIIAIILGEINKSLPNMDLLSGLLSQVSHWKGEHSVVLYTSEIKA